MKLLITEAFKPESNYSCIYFLEEDRFLQRIDYRPVHKLYPQNDTPLCFTQLPPELKDMIIEILIDTALVNRQIILAIKYIFINAYHVNRFYNRFFELDLALHHKTLASILRVSALLNLFRDTDDWLIDAARIPVGFKNMSINLGSHIDLLKPWSYEGEFEIDTVAQPTVLFPESCKNLNMTQVITGPFHTEIVWLGGTARYGLIDVKYYKNPIIMYTLCNIEFTGSEDLDVNADFFVQPEWEGFGNLARLIFGHNAGVFFQINTGLPDDLVFTSPVIFEV